MSDFKAKIFRIPCMRGSNYAVLELCPRPRWELKALTQILQLYIFQGEPTAKGREGAGNGEGTGR